MKKTATAKVKVVKVFPAKGGAKAEVEMPGGIRAYLKVGYDGQLAEKIKEGTGKVFILEGTLRYPKEVDLPVFEATGELNDRVVLIGRLTKEAELKYSQKGVAYTHFSLAVNYGWGDKKETDFVNCTIFGNEKERNAAVALAEKGGKGRQIIVSGHLSQNKKGNKVYTNLIVDEFEFIGQNGEKQAPPENTYEEWEGSVDVDF